MNINTKENLQFYHILFQMRGGGGGGTLSYIGYIDNTAV